MAESRLSTSDEMLTVVGGRPRNKRFFSPKKPSKPKYASTEGQNTPADTEDELPPVLFLSMLRFSTSFELVLDAIGLLAATASGAAMPLMTLLFGRLTQDFVDFIATGDPKGFRQAAARNASYLAYIGVGMFFCTFLYMCIWVYTGEVNAKRIRENYLRAILRQDIAFFDKVGAGEVATRIQTDCHLVQQGISEKVPLAVTFLSAFVTGFALSYSRSWRLALALTSIFPCIAIAGGLMNKFVSKYMQLSLKSVARGGGLAEEVISTVRTAQAFGTHTVLSQKYDSHVIKARNADGKSAAWHGGGLAVFIFVLYAAYALSFSFGTTLINQGHADSGVVVNVFLAILIGSFSLALLAPELQAINHGRAAAAHLFITINRVPEIDSSSPDGRKPDSVDGEIIFENVFFNYPSRPAISIVKGINLRFSPGKSAALVGASGSGKSTVISLVERFYDPLSGSVKLDGHNINDLNLKWLRSQIGLVSQEPTLFATTIRQNVEHGLINTPYENSPLEEKFTLVKEACLKANADGFISKLPNGYDTMVGERGFLLSGGQKQRIAIARAIVSDPKILLLDEATSALDTQSEGIVQNALDKASQGRTTITIAHRLSTVKNADIIYVMGDGLVLESGTHTELLHDTNGPYSRLCFAQMLRESHETATYESVNAQRKDQQVSEEVVLDQQSTRRSLTSKIIEQDKQWQHQERLPGAHYSLPFLFKRMGALNRDQLLKYLTGAAFAIMSGMVYPGFGIVFANGVEAFSYPDPAKRRFEGDRTALWLFIIAIVASTAIGFQNYFFGSAASELTYKLRHLSFKTILRQDIAYFDRDENSTGSLTSALSDNPQKVYGLAGITLGAIIQSLGTLVVGTIVGLAFAWKLALVAFACSPLLVSAGYIRLRVVVLKDQTNKRAHEESAQLACEAVGSIRTLASLTREDDCMRLYSETLEVPLRNSKRTAFWSNLLFAASQSLSFFVIALVFWYGSRLVSTGELNTFSFFVTLMSTTFGAIQAGNVFAFVPDISQAQNAGTDLVKLLDSVPEIDALSDEGQKITGAKGQICIEDVHFQYPTRPGVRVLSNLNLTVEPGAYIALVGASGSGKSTVIQLIERFYDPLAGDIYLDGQRIRGLNVASYRRQLALVSQEPTLYGGTVRFNILLGAAKPVSEVTQSELEEACQKANILEFIQGLPDGFDTEVGGKGSQLSGGQKQRIAIARALIRNPKVLLLDEATSALDSNSEKVVQEALDKAAKGRTTIVVAHRLSTIQNADRIYFIKDGQVEELGTHDQLLAQKGAYAEYVALQKLSKAH